MTTSTCTYLLWLGEDRGYAPCGQVAQTRDRCFRHKRLVGDRQPRPHSAAPQVRRYEVAS